MKKLILSLLISSSAMLGFSTTWTVTNSGFAFTPATLTIHEGDTVVFSLANIHTVVETSQATWNNNDNDALAGGFQLPNGGGTVLPAKLTVGNHWYVCGPHASGGMKGMITVETSTATYEPTQGIGLTLMPNPTNGKFQVIWANASSSDTYKVEILNLTGQVMLTSYVEGEQLLSPNFEVNLSDYPRGIYLVRVHVGIGIQTRKLILN